jgi:hypothetical protein
MSRHTIIKCNQCGKTKGVDNHWFYMFNLSHYHPEAGIATAGWVVSKDKGITEYGIEDEILDLCSTECIKLQLNTLLKVTHPAVQEAIDSCKPVTVSGPMPALHMMEFNLTRAEKMIREMNELVDRVSAGDDDRSTLVFKMEEFYLWYETHRRRVR